MNPLVVLNLGKGNAQEGLPIVTAQLWLEDSQVPVKYVGSLPTARALPKLYHRWQALYEALHQSLIRRHSTGDPIEFESGTVTNVSRADFQHLCVQLQVQMNQWLNSSGFRNIDQQLRTKLDVDESIRVIIETDDPLLQKLPWHLWRFFEHYTKAEVALSASEYERATPPPSRVSPKMRILVVLGHSEGIDIQSDRVLLESMDAETVVLTEPERSELDRWLWDQAGWDILFFAGHSTSQAVSDSGEVIEQLFLNPQEQLSIAHLKYALKASINRGLKLAIFNSCDGLGLARALGDLNLPQLIVMREPVTDRVAHTFLQNFLQVFSNGEAFYTAVRYAREQLQGLESSSPCASWLPVIYQNPAEVPLVWPQSLKQRRRRKILAQGRGSRSTSTRATNLRNLLLTSVVMTFLIMTVRGLGLLQPLELSAYDSLMVARPVEWEAAIDERLLVVEITEDDTDEYGYPIRDGTLALALEKLQRYRPQTIGIDLHRYQPNQPGRDKLIEQFENSSNLVTVCVFDPKGREILGHPPEFSVEQASNQVGFSDLELDGDFDGGRDVVRRQLLSYDPNQGFDDSNCITSYSFSFNLAMRFLTSKGIEPLTANKDHHWQLGTVVFNRLAPRTGGYQKLDGQSSQVLLNYRFNPKPAQKISLGDVIKEEFSETLVQNRIVLIGVTDEQIGNDYLNTPYGNLPGVWIHAHGISQILSAVIEDRSLVWVLPQWHRLQWGDGLWVWVWGLVGGLLVWQMRSVWLLTLAGAMAVWGLYQICLLTFVRGGWLPLVPALLTLVGTAGFLLIRKYTYSRLNFGDLLHRFGRKRY
ncbi:MAG: CHASE2 domain-containing protein [Cyanobacteria bacterium P01_H01_bin.26]